MVLVDTLRDWQESGFLSQSVMLHFPGYVGNFGNGGRSSGNAGNVGWLDWRGVLAGGRLVLREAKSSKCFQRRPMLREVRSRMARVRIVKRREEKKVEELEELAV